MNKIAPILILFILVMALSCNPGEEDHRGYEKGTIVDFDTKTVTVVGEARFGYSGRTFDWEYPDSIEFQLYDDIRGVLQAGRGKNYRIVNFVIIPVDRY